MKLFGEAKKGFTLIELLVVIAIIGVLSTIILISVDVARARARDANRVAQVRQMQTALELYYTDHNQYPEDGCAAGGHSPGCGCISFSYTAELLHNGGYLGDVPEDPQHPSPCYQYQQNYTGPSCGGAKPTPNYVLLFRGESQISEEYTPWVETGSGYRCLMP